MMSNFVYAVAFNAVSLERVASTENTPFCLAKWYAHYLSPITVSFWPFTTCFFDASIAVEAEIRLFSKLATDATF